MGARKLIDWDAQPLGQVGDSALARLLGCTPGAVAKARYQRNIHAANVAYQHRRVALRPAVEAPAPDEAALAARAAAWDQAPVTSDGCRCCLDTAIVMAGASRKHPRRWTDQGACCRAHYLALPACAACGAAPVANAGEWCEACCGRYQRAVGEAGGWRSGEGPAAPAPIGLGTAAALAHGLARFEERHGRARVMR